MKSKSINPIYMIPFMLSGIAWRAGGDFWWFGPLSSLILPIGIPAITRKSERFVAAMAYFASGSFGLISGAGVFFGTGDSSYLFGAILWLASSAALAAPWIFASTGPMAILALLLDAMPPLGLFGWLSPLAAAGVLFPGAGIFGIVLLLLGISRFKWSLRLAFVLMIGFFMTNHESDHLNPFTGIDTNFGKLPMNPMMQIRRNSELISMIGKSNHADIVFPETLVNYESGTIHQFENSIPVGRTILLGVTTVGRKGEMSDSIAEIGHDKSRIMFTAALPVPVSMWKPWSNEAGYKATWSEPVRKIDGTRVGAVICYDQLLVWPWIELASGEPDVVLAVANDWWASGTGIPVIQKNSSIAWSGLIGAKMVSAVNE